jgi:hypothetical protein
VISAFFVGFNPFPSLWIHSTSCFFVFFLSTYSVPCSILEADWATFKKTDFSNDWICSAIQPQEGL